MDVFRIPLLDYLELLNSVQLSVGIPTVELRNLEAGVGVLPRLSVTTEFCGSTVSSRDVLGEDRLRGEELEVDEEYNGKNGGEVLTGEELDEVDNESLFGLKVILFGNGETETKSNISSESLDLTS